MMSALNTDKQNQINFRGPTAKIIFLTGASGFIGSGFLQFALARGYRIRALTRNSNRRAIQDGLEWYQGDLMDGVDWGRALLNVDIVVHAAAEVYDESLMHKINVGASLRLLNAAIDSGVRRWVQLSSVGAYGPVQKGIVTEDWQDNPIGNYEASKAAFDQKLKHVASTNRLEVCIIRPSNVYGANMRNQSIRQMTSSLRKGLFAFIGPSGASANYVHVSDVVQALDLCVSHPDAANQTYIISEWATMEDMILGLSEGLGIKQPTRRINLRLASWLAFVFHKWPRWPLTAGRVRAMSLRSRYSTKKIETELGWKSTVSVRNGMKAFAKFQVK